MIRMAGVRGQGSGERGQRTEDRFRANLFCGSLPAGELLGVAARDIFAYGQDVLLA